jgi:hypothetical protein
MKDPWSGEEARELWNGVQQAQQEAAAYREAFAKPEDVRALKELYPGGVEQARATAERARTLEEIDTAFYGGAGKSPEQLSAGRTALAQRMLREDPAAFREMVFAGLRALEQAGASPNVGVPIRSASGDFPAVARTTDDPDRAGAATSSETATNRIPVGARHAVAAPPAPQDVQLTEYHAFEKSANEELERSVGGAISRVLEQALPVAQPILAVRGDARPGKSESRTNESAQTRLSALQQRLGGAIRADVESALKGDRQLGEQIAQVMSTRRFDDTTRAQVVRLISDRAQQLIPTAAKRVLQDWTQTALASHRARTQSSDTSRERSNFSPNATANSSASASNAPSGTSGGTRSISAKASAADRAENAVRHTASGARNTVRHGVDYRKLSDEQILEM